MATVISTTASRIVRRTQTRTSLSSPPMPLPAGESGPRLTGAGVAKPAAAPSHVHLVDHPVAQHALTILCDKHSSQYDVRFSCNQLLVLLALEAMRSLPTRAIRVDTSRGAWDGVALAKPVVLLAVSRNGVSLSHNLMECLPGLLVGSITITGSGEGPGFQTRLHLASAPSLRDCRVILFNPVIQSGASAGAALELVRQLGATDITLLTFTISAQGLLRLQAATAELRVWTAHVDAEWDAKRSPASALGDFSTRLFA
jgi:uracil phosphoribosyltransferase